MPNTEDQIADLLKFFRLGDLEGVTLTVATPYADLAENIGQFGPKSRWTVLALQRLLESRDAMIRSALSELEDTPTT